MRPRVHLLFLDTLKLKNIKFLSNITIVLLVLVAYQNFISTNKYYFKLEEYYSYTENL